MDEFDLLIAAPETAEHLDLIRQYLDRAYREARDRFDPQIGCDNRTFGMEIYSFAWFRIQEGNCFKVTENLGPFTLPCLAIEGGGRRTPMESLPSRTSRA